MPSGHEAPSDFTDRVFAFANQLLGQELDPELQAMHRHIIDCQSKQSRPDLIKNLRDELEAIQVSPDCRSSTWHNTGINLISDTLKADREYAYQQLLEEIWLSQDDELHQLVDNWMRQ